MQAGQKRVCEGLLWAWLGTALLCSLYVFAERVAGALADPVFRIDISVFRGAALRFLETGALYLQGADLARAYGPGEAVYKFPPAYQLTLVPWLAAGLDGPALLRVLRLFYLLAYLVGVGAILTALRLRPVCLALALLLALWFAPFVDCLVELEPEILLFAWLALAFACCTRAPLAAGLFVALAVAIKLYPVVVLLYFVVMRQWRGLAGFGLGLLAVTALSVAVFGLESHRFYLFELLPVLLAEPPAVHAQNVSLEFFLYLQGWWPGMNGRITVVLQALVLGVAGMGLLRRLPDTADTRQGVFCLFCCGMLLWLGNYWVQYLFILLLPMLYLCRAGCQGGQPALWLAVVFCGLALGLDRDWLMRPAQLAAELMPPAQLQPWLAAGDPAGALRAHFPLHWLGLEVVALRPLLPLLLFVLLCRQVSRTAPVP